MSDGRSNRRDFLFGKAAFRAAEDLLKETPPDALSAAGPPGSPDLAAGEAAARDAEPRSPQSAGRAEFLIHLSRTAMACEFQIYLNAGQYLDGAERAMAGLDLIEQLEAQLSVYREASEVSRLNQAANQAAEPADAKPLEPIAVEERLFALLQQAVELWRETGGAYDLTAGPLSKVWGFYRRAGSIPTQDDLQRALERVGSQHLLLDPAAQTVGFARRGVEINLGSIGKGYALDRCGELLAAEGIDDFLLHGGNSSVVARGSRAAAEEPGWSVGLRHPWRSEQRLGVFHLHNQALGTSGSEAQFFLHQGRRYGHILDPRTGWPAEGVLTATVVAPTGAQADSLSTAFFVLGPEGAQAYCQRHREISAVLIAPGKKANSIVQHRFNVADTLLSAGE